MNPDEFSLIRNDEMLNESTLAALRSLVTRYPYYQAARLLLIKNMQRSKSLDFDKELRKAALFAPDRSTLFYIIEGDKYRLVPEENAKPQSANEANVERTSGSNDRTTDLIDDFLVAMPDAQPHRRLTLADAANDYAAYLAQQDEEVSAHSEPESSAGNGRNTAKRKNTKKSIAKDARHLQETSHEEKHDSHDAAHLSADDTQEFDYVRTPKESEEGYFTETLAKIYIKQGKYSRAIEILRRLNADYPKKSSYFADQIRFLEKATINNKNNKQ